MPRPMSAAHLAELNLQVPELAPRTRRLMAELAAFVEETPGIWPDYQRSSAAARPSFGTKYGRSSLWFIGYRSHASQPDLVVLPNRGRGLPEGMSQRLVHALAERGFRRPIGERIPLASLNDAEVQALRVATAAATASDDD